jgi:UDP:flavonoid glycosyltransferase YjiC (YdhE family)
MKIQQNSVDIFLRKNIKQEFSSSNINNEQLIIIGDCNLSRENFEKQFKPIIYVSMGTLFNNENSSLFETIANACKKFSKEYSIIISTGDQKTFEKYANSSLNSENILFVPHTPQIDLLKVTHLFITHAGM